MLQGNKKDIEKLLPYVSERLQKALAYVAATDFSNCLLYTSDAADEL